MVERHLAKVDTAVRFCSLALIENQDSKEGFNSSVVLWSSGLSRLPVTEKIASSNLVRTAIYASVVQW